MNVGQEDKKYYHTQERWRQRLTGPVQTFKDNAWLGSAYYFWYEFDDAIFWGISSKKRTGYYEVYSAAINMDNVLNTVFDESHYLFWIKQIERVAKHFLLKTKLKPNLKEINEYFKEKGIWTKFDGIVFQDISNNPAHYLVSEFQYKKRIQIAVFNIEIVSKFTYEMDGKCS